MDQNKIALASLSMDLKRVALGTNRGSFEMANKFKIEAIKRLEEIDSRNVEPYLQEIMKRVGKMLSSRDNSRLAEDSLMYSVIVQNYVLFK